MTAAEPVLGGVQLGSSEEDWTDLQIDAVASVELCAAAALLFSLSTAARPEAASPSLLLEEENRVKIHQLLNIMYRNGQSEQNTRRIGQHGPVSLQNIVSYIFISKCFDFFSVRKPDCVTLTVQRLQFKQPQRP